MQTTFDGWIMNPMVKDNAVFTHRDMYKKLYTEKFDAVLLREAGKIDYKLYIDKKTDRYFAHIKIPSEVVPKFYYDVVVEFYTKDNAIRATRSLKDYLVRFYSNDPAFVFTYLRVFKKNDMFISELASKSPKMALNKDPKQKNPFEVISYVKSLYFAYLLMKSRNLFSKIVYETYAEPFNSKKMLSTVRDASVVIDERTKKGEEITKKKKQEKLAQRSTIDTVRQATISGRVTQTPENIRVGKTSAASSTKSSKTTRRTGKSATTKTSKKI